MRGPPVEWTALSHLAQFHTAPPCSKRLMPGIIDPWHTVDARTYPSVLYHVYKGGRKQTEGVPAQTRLRNWQPRAWFDDGSDVNFRRDSSRLRKRSLGE